MSAHPEQRHTHNAQQQNTRWWQNAYASSAKVSGFEHDKGMYIEKMETQSQWTFCLRRACAFPGVLRISDPNGIFTWIRL